LRPKAFGHEFIPLALSHLTRLTAFQKELAFANWSDKLTGYIIRGEQTLAKTGHVNFVEMLKAIHPRSLDSAVLDALAGFIESAGIEPGSRLPSERLLCEQLGVSRPTVREALKRWEALGIVEMRKGAGAFLRASVSPNLLHVPLILARPEKVENLLHVLQVRRALEGEAAAICARSASADDIAEIELALIRLETARAHGDDSEEDWQFHQAIYSAAANPFFTNIIQSMQNLMHQFWENPLNLPNFAAASHSYHRTMFEAIAGRDEDSARIEAWKIIDSVESDIRKAFPDED
jgi:GntR family transcriptional regulator, transcriptional repressor for pyruvate dehydrogenase complex